MGISLKKDITGLVLESAVACSHNAPTLKLAEIKVVIAASPDDTYQVHFSFFGKEAMRVSTGPYIDNNSLMHIAKDVLQPLMNAEKLTDLGKASRDYLRKVYLTSLAYISNYFPLIVDGGSKITPSTIKSYKQYWAPVVLTATGLGGLSYYDADYMFMKGTPEVYKHGPSAEKPTKKVPAKSKITKLPGICNLREATVIGQEVHGSSEGSIYIYCAYCEGGLKVATRVLGMKLSIRAEATTGIKNFEDRVAAAGLGIQSPHHASMHLSPKNSVDMDRVIGGVLWSLRPIIIEDGALTG